jgi:hypothetical protein
MAVAERVGLDRVAKLAQDVVRRRGVDRAALDDALGEIGRDRAKHWFVLERER